MVFLKCVCGLVLTEFFVCVEECYFGQELCGACDAETTYSQAQMAPEAPQSDTQKYTISVVHVHIVLRTLS